MNTWLFFIATNIVIDILALYLFASCFVQVFMDHGFFLYCLYIYTVIATSTIAIVIAFSFTSISQNWRNYKNNFAFWGLKYYVADCKNLLNFVVARCWDFKSFFIFSTFPQKMTLNSMCILLLYLSTHSRQNYYCCPQKGKQLLCFQIFNITIVILDFSL